MGSRDILEDNAEDKEKVVVIDFPDLHPAQEEVRDSEARWKILCAGRRFGKSRLGVQLCMQKALDGGRVWWVAPTFAIARVGWRDVVAAAQSFPKEVGVDIKVGDMTVYFPSGGSIAVKSADNPQRLRGEGLHYLVMDEAAFVREENWTEVLRPTLTENKGEALLQSKSLEHIPSKSCPIPRYSFNSAARIALVPTPSVAEHKVTSLLTLYSALNPSLLPKTFGL